MKYVDQSEPLFVCHRAGKAGGDDLFPNHGESRIIGWVYGSKPTDIGMICTQSTYDGFRMMIPFNPESICCMARTPEGLMHKESGVR